MSQTTPTIEDITESISKAAHDLSVLIETTIVPIFDEMAQRIADVGKILVIALQPALSKTFKDIRRLRMPNETITAYLKRNPDMVENPDIRWEYQVYILSAPIRWMKTIFKLNN